MTLAIGLGDVQAAHARIRDAVRCTPCVPASFLREAPLADATLSLKLECLQVSGSFKARGACHKVATLSPEALARGLVTASGGNHGLGVAYAGWRAGVPVRVYLPRSTPAAKERQLLRWGARVVRHGEVWDEANDAATRAAQAEDLAYVHPFADAAVMAGQGTVGLEILAQASDLDTVLVAIGGGGLISGIATAVKGLRPAVRVIGVEPVGAPTLRASVDAGRVVTLARISTAAGTLAPRTSHAYNLAIIEQHVDDIVLVSDEQMRDAARWLWSEMGIAAELSAAAALAALRTGRYPARAGEHVCVLVCGAGTDGIQGAERC
jgi:threonine dehydratase